MSDPFGGRPGDESEDIPAGAPSGQTDDLTDADDNAETGLGWRALAGSLDDPMFGVPLPPSAPSPAAVLTDPDPTTPDPVASDHSVLDPAAPAADTTPDTATADSLTARPRRRQFSRTTVTVLAAITLLAIAIVAGTQARFPDRAVVAPGGTFDIEEFVEVHDHPAYVSDASISLVSVRTSFDPSLFEVVGGWLDGALEVVDISDILGERTITENREDGRLQMDQSTQIAVAVALEHLGHEIMDPIGARIEWIVPDSPADAAELQDGDIVQTVGGTLILTAPQLSDTIKASEPGTEVALTALDPEGATRTITATLGERDGLAHLGVVVTTHVTFAALPIDVALNVENIGGPSAGLAFTLSVIDVLTPEPLTGDLDVIATGTIHHDGTVGPIGGVPQKAHSTVRAGVDLFLVPASQAEEAAEVAEPSVKVVGVETLAEALAAIEAHQR
ncbi:S16 family serine protease [Candidatus Poriferisodalis sp.]|uniref:S16 family serine protease n=1 Tax=Candidatus Poriferisodalis sp. TaxID=3101277 RepID=UPI003B021F96